MVKNAIKVYARLKPQEGQRHLMNYKIYRRPKEHSDEDFLVLVASHKSGEYIDHRPETWNFSFYQVFDMTVNQDDVFENVALPVVQSTLNGYNGTIFAYGQTGSGKTFSITGDKDSNDDRGIIPRTLQYIFRNISQHPENVYSVEVAYLEIYNENGYDLLDRKSAITRLEDLPRVTIQEDESGKLRLKNLIFHRVESEEDALEMLLIGDANRVTAETPMNPQSSRSHCIFTIVVSVKQFGAHSYKRAKMHLVDLAGSERVYKCAISGTTLTEAKHINLSLHYLEQVIVCLGQEAAGHIPYRNSLLTAILRDSLGGNCLTTMLATLSATSPNIQETISTCRFAQRVALVRNDVNLVLDKSADCENALLRLENERLRKQIEMLQAQTVETSRELTDSEKKSLDSRVERFLNLNDSICWDNDPRKVSYCFGRLRNHFLLDGNKEVSKKLEHCKKLVARRDKEISLLVEMLRKERMKNSNDNAGSCDTNNAIEATHLLEKHKEISKNPNELVGTNSILTAAPCKILNLNLDDAFNNDNAATKDVGPMDLKSQTSLSSIQNLASFSSRKKLSRVSENSERPSHRKQDPCSPTQTVKENNEIYARDYSASRNTILLPAMPSTVRQTVQISFPSKKTNLVDAETKVPESVTAFDVINKFRDDLQAKLTARSNASKVETKPDESLPRKSVTPKSSYCDDLSTKLTVRSNTSINETKLDVNLSGKPVTPKSSYCDELPTKLTVRSNRSIIGSKPVTPKNSCSNPDQSFKESETLDCSENRTGYVDKGMKTDGRGVNVSKPCDFDDEEFEKTLPLTGDPEIDEEIVAFYKAKRMGVMY